MKKKITGGARFRKEQMNKRFKMLAYFGLTVIAFIIFGTASGDVLTGLGFATMLPIGFEGKTLARGLGKGDGDEGDPDPTEEIKKITAEYKQKLDDLKALVAKGVSQDDIDKVKGEIKELSEKRMTAMDDLIKKHGEAVLKQGETITALKNEMKTLENQKKAKESLADAIHSAIKEKQSEIDTILKNNGKMSGPLQFEIKAAINMTNTANVEAAGSASHYSLTSDTGIISQLRSRILRYLQNVSVGALSVDKPYAMWIEELDEQGTPIFIGEGDTKTQLSVRYEEREKKSKKIGVHGKVTTEMLRYSSKLVSYIQNNLLRRVDVKTEDQLFNGDDTGDNLAGLLSYATAFDGGVGTAGGDGLVGAVTAPNMHDVLRALALQVENSYGIPTKVFVKTDLFALMDVEKDSQDQYVMPPFRSANGTMVAGLTVVPTVALNSTSYDFVGGDLSVVNVEFLNNISVQIGLDGNDFTKNMKTILVEQELVQFVSANDTQVLVKGTFTAAKDLIRIA